MWQARAQRESGWRWRITDLLLHVGRSFWWVRGHLLKRSSYFLTDVSIDPSKPQNGPRLLYANTVGAKNDCLFHMIFTIKKWLKATEEHCGPYFFQRGVQCGQWELSHTEPQHYPKKKTLIILWNPSGDIFWQIWGNGACSVASHSAPTSNTIDLGPSPTQLPELVSHPRTKRKCRGGKQYTTNAV